jgi:hypothetical protein
MNKNFTQAVKYNLLLIALTSLFSYSIKAQTTPSLVFKQPKLVAGTNGKVGATYKFSNVVPNINAYVKIENIVNGAVLVNIDDSTLGYYNAWQPTVGGPGTYGSSYIKWDIRFDSAGSNYVFKTLDASATDIDGDNVRVREFININGQSSYSIPTQVPTLLTVSEQKDTDNINGTDPSDSNLHALGPIINRTGIDTLSQDVRLDFTVLNKSEFKIYTGSQVDNNGTTGAISTDRYHCIYFMHITGFLSVLPTTIQTFSASVDKNKVYLYWTAGELPSSAHFEVERSFDQNSFSTVALVLGPQSSLNNSDQYSYTDNADQLINHNAIYYRLKEVDLNGSVSYSSIKMVQLSNMNVSANTVLKIFPNPYMDKINVNYESDENGKVEIRMFNSSGNVVKKIESVVTSGYNNVQIQDLNSLAPGIYIVNVALNGQTINNQKIVKL